MSSISAVRRSGFIDRCAFFAGKAGDAGLRGVVVEEFQKGSRIRVLEANGVIMFRTRFKTGTALWRLRNVLEFSGPPGAR